MKNFDIPLHTRGESVFLDDIPAPGGLLHAAVFPSPLAHGKIKRLDVEKARRSPGVIAVFTAADIPGQNQVGGIILDETLLAGEHVKYMGEPIALVIAETKVQAKKAFTGILLELDPLPVVIDPRESYAKGTLITPPRTFALGDVAAAWDTCDVIVSGRVDSGGQEHFYMEPQSALAVPVEKGGVKIYSSTQSPSVVQRIAARVLGVPMHKIEVDVRRLGGGFGGKEDQATPWACLAALAAFILKKPVKLILDRCEDMMMTGKRHPYSSDFKLGLKADGSILAYEVFFYQNSGAAADLSTAILERTLFHTTNSYYIPNVKATAACCYTNLAPFTAFRGFGGPQAMFVLESAIREAAEKLNLHPSVIQQKNLLHENDTFPYGQPVENCRARRCWQETMLRYDFEKINNDVGAFNAANKLKKKGTAVMPVCFGISFTTTMMNQAGALVHVYTDGSVGVSSGAVEMGQGVNMKILRVAAHTFSIAGERIKIETTNTTRVANTSPTAASSAADMNGKAVETACFTILERLKQVAAAHFNHSSLSDIEIKDEKVYLSNKPTDLTWEKLVTEAFQNRVNLSAQGYYATPGIYFDRAQEKGKPFAYHVFGTAIIEVTLDCLRGTYDIDAVHIVHDGGRSLDYHIDLGQVEGGLLQGIGWMTMEELVYCDDGKLLTRNTGTYKIPDIKSTPGVVQVHFLEDADNPRAVLSSKAIGEPPFMYGIGVYFAILNAMKAFRPEKKLVYDSPLTPEKVLTYLY
ncbi:MAG TPA: molybdopterin cofactor-binding domain-containing protein [Candidatus Deferrimicrobium sp.]|nr:molybdopterin cofactor-binding domain-containing protein [Candidatus Deferrimicrobium sp.]